MLPLRAVKSGVARARRRWHDLQPDHRQRGQADLARLKQRFPELADFDHSSNVPRHRFAADYYDYIDTIGHPVHAASLEMAIVLWLFAEAVEATRVVDLGSGFSSYVLRTWGRGTKRDPEVWSVDDSPEWLDKTRDYLARRATKSEHLHTWDEFRSVQPGGFDLVLHDMGSMETREETLEEVLGLARPGGLVIVDDTHKPCFREAMLEVLERTGKEHFSLRELTRDRLTRYAWLVIA